MLKLTNDKNAMEKKNYWNGVLKEKSFEFVMLETFKLNKQNMFIQIQGKTMRQKICFFSKYARDEEKKTDQNILRDGGRMDSEDQDLKD